MGAPVGTAVVAPASGVILYAAAPVGSNSGYLGNWTGYPAGGGNTIQMLCNVNGTLYAVKFLPFIAKHLCKCRTECFTRTNNRIIWKFRKFKWSTYTY